MSIKKKSRRSQTDQIHPRVSRVLVQELKRQAKHRRTSESAIVEAALRTFLNQTEHEAVIDRRLNKLQKQLEKMRHEQQVHIETLATFVKVYLAHTPEIPEGQKKSLESRSADRFERFIDVVAKAFEKETQFKEAVEERVMTLRDFRPEA